MLRVVILGAGIAGLTAARELARSGEAMVTVVEEQDRPGGLAITLEREGSRMDLGPHRLHTELPEAQAVYDEFPLGERIETVRRSRMLLRGALYRYPPSLVELGLRMPLQSLRFGADLLVARSRGVARQGSGEPSCADVLRALYGTALYDFFFGPYLAKVWKTVPERLDGRIVRARIAPAGGGLLRAIRPPTVGRLRYLRGGVEALPRRLASQVTQAGGRILCGARVEGLEGDGVRIRSVHCQTADGPLRLEGDVFLSTLPLPALVAMCAPLRPFETVQRAAAGLRYLGLTLVNPRYSVDRVGPDSWMYFPDAATPFNRFHEPKNFDPAMAPAGQSLLCVEITSLTGRVATRPADDERLLESVVAELDRQGVADRRRRNGGWVHTVPHAYPLYARDFRSRFEKTLTALDEMVNLIPFGRQGLFCHNNMDHSIVMGLRAAQAARAAHPARAMADHRPEFDRFRIVD